MKYLSKNVQKTELRLRCRSYVGVDEGVVVSQVLVKDSHELVHVVLKEGWEVNEIEVVEDPDNEEQVGEEQVQVLL